MCFRRTAAPPPTPPPPPPPAPPTPAPPPAPVDSTVCRTTSGVKCLFPFKYLVPFFPQSCVTGTFKITSTLSLTFKCRVLSTTAARPETGAALGAAPTASRPGRPGGETAQQWDAEEQSNQVCTRNSMLYNYR